MNWEEFYKWMKGKLVWSLFITGIVGAVTGIAYLMSKPKKSSPQGGSYRYTTLPKACRCPVCGYTVENPGVHCPELGPCPKCGAPRLYRVK